MEESNTIEMVVSQLDKRLASVEQNLLQLRSEIGQLRSEVFSEMRSNFRWTIATMITLFGIAVPVWMWVLGRILKGL